MRTARKKERKKERKLKACSRKIRHKIDTLIQAQSCPHISTHMGLIIASEEINNRVLSSLTKGQRPTDHRPGVCYLDFQMIVSQADKT